MNAETRALILDSTIAVWIDCEIETLVERTSRRNSRPLLRNGDPKEILSRLSRERAPHYREAHVRVLSEDGPHADTAKSIIEGIGAWLT